MRVAERAKECAQLRQVECRPLPCCRDEVAELLRGEIYDVEKALVLPAQEIISEVRPEIVVANAALVERLRRQPESIYRLPARQFEEVIAELLDDMGYGGYVGCEYRPRGRTEDGLGWFREM